MAETLIPSLIQKLGSLLIDEANYLLQVKLEVESLCNELSLINPYLKEADAQHHKSDLAKVWVRQLRELAFQAEDAIDIFVYQVAQKRQEGVIRKIAKFPKRTTTAHQLRGKVEDIKGKLNRLFIDKMNYDIKPLDHEDQPSPYEAHRSEAALGDRNFRPIGVEVVGLQSEAKELVKLLIEEEPHRPFRVISVTGMGGLGKTTLAQKVYNRDDVKNHFVYRAFVRISREYQVKDVLMKIMKQVMVPMESEKAAWGTEDVADLKEMLSKFLEEKKKSFLFLLDDVWTKQDWDKLQGIFPIPCSGGQQCRVLLTTRDEGVARHADPNVPPYKLPFLDEKKSLELFWKVFFRSPNEEDVQTRLNKFDEGMKDLAPIIVKECDGLPLAIVVIGGLLSGRRLNTAAEWKKFLNNVNLHLRSRDCEKVLALSYTELPYYLKPCFLYFGVFPEDTVIDRDELIRLWVAEGFLEARGDSVMEDVGGECLEELMQRNLIQVVKWKSNGVPQSFIIHDLLLDLAISEAKEGNFFNIISTQNSFGHYRRVAFHGNSSEDTTSSNYNLSDPSLLRSLLCFTEIMSPSLCGRLKLLNVLDLKFAYHVGSIPKEIRKLIFLKYLRLRGQGLKLLPPWVGNLYNLQTFDIQDTGIRKLPIEILKLEKLRHLLTPEARIQSRVSGIKSGIGICRRPYHHRIRHMHSLSHLQTLWVEAGHWIEDGLEKLIYLRDLRVTFYMDRQLDRFTEALVNLVYLEVLYLISDTNDEEICLPDTNEEICLPSFSSHNHLYSIDLTGAIKKLPNVDNFPPNLTRLTLSDCHLKEDVMVTLEKLPQLKDLSLEWSPYDGAVMKCSAGGFSKLERLILFHLKWLRYWIVEEGAMSNLRILIIINLQGLKWIPGGVRHIKTLQELRVNMPKEFLERVKEDGQDWEKIKHVPSVITNQVIYESCESPHEFAERERLWFESTGERVPTDD